ncbi:E3 ubiquitin-protein ligase TRIM50 isoform X2 [Colius striatus]|uniref:E3 ubiquitin-protein ligase TRIM50 isoform X2 n=1 Tax=Colius striatus TaxID=57412 RepID=UPI002B1E2006|nr:E3 ubiquitin-protein ligase TRIM50 isoform X2 [Colius striatus]
MVLACGCSTPARDRGVGMAVETWHSWQGHSVSSSQLRAVLCMPSASGNLRSFRPTESRSVGHAKPQKAQGKLKRTQLLREELSVLLTDIHQYKRNLDEHFSKLINNKSRITNEVDVFRCVIQKEFQELHRYIDEEKATFLESIEGKAAQLITSIESQVKQTSDALQRLKKMQSSLEALSNESQLDFIQKYSSSQFRSELLSLHPADGIFSPVSFKPCFHQDDIKMTVWKRLHRRVLPAPETLKLDPVTAHPLLELFKGDTVVQCGLYQRRDSNPQRFDSSNCILTCKGFSSGQHYWEVIVGTRNHWRVGIIKGTVSRKGKLSKSPEHGVWLIGLKEGKVYEAFSSPRAVLPLSARPQRIGVYLHYERGELSFYNADNPDELSPIYTFQAEFQGQLYPIVDLCWPERGPYSPPIILPAPAASRPPRAPCSQPAPEEAVKP